MNFRRLASWIFGSGSGYRSPPVTHHRDSNLGEYHFFSDINLWTHRRPYGTGELQICGRSEHPTVEQKQLLELFLPLLSSLTKDALKKLAPPKGFVASDMPKLLHLRELRFEATGDVELFFDPSLEVEGYEACPMATCSSDGQLRSVCWTV